MPYIARGLRDEIDSLIPAKLHFAITTEGELNYVITRLALAFARRQGANYAAYNKTVGVMESAKLEFYRRHVAPYEDEKIKENGDVT